MQKFKRVLIISDLHSGHRVGLTPPRHQPKVDDDAPHDMKKFAEMRVAMWNWFEKEINKIRPIHKLICNGDMIEGKGVRSGSTELITADRNEQAIIAADAINFVSANEVWCTYGTGYHVGTDEDWENIVCDKVDNFQKIEAEGHYDINGLKVVCKHFIGNTSSPASRGTALSNAQIKQMLWALRGQQPLANLIVRSHVHRCFGIMDYGANFQAITTPGLQGLGTKFGSRQCDGLPIDFGFIILDIVSPQEWSVEARIMPMSYAECDINKL